MSLGQGASEPTGEHFAWRPHGLFCFRKWKGLRCVILPPVTGGCGLPGRKGWDVEGREVQSRSQQVGRGSFQQGWMSGSSALRPGTFLPSPCVWHEVRTHSEHCPWTLPGVSPLGDVCILSLQDCKRDRLGGQQPGLAQIQPLLPGRQRPLGLNGSLSRTGHWAAPTRHRDA